MKKVKLNWAACNSEPYISLNNNYRADASQDDVHWHLRPADCFCPPHPPTFPEIFPETVLYMYHTYAEAVQSLTFAKTKSSIHGLWQYW